MKPFEDIVLRILKAQEALMGAVAWEQAEHVDGLKVVSPETGRIAIQGDGKEVVNQLVAKFAELFGSASNEVCKEATRDLIVALQPDDVPESLRV